MSRVLFALLIASLSIAGCRKHRPERKRQSAPEPAGSCPPTDRRGDKNEPIDRMRATIFANLKLEPGMRIADIGMGNGWFLGRAAEQIGPKGRAYGTDIDAGAVQAVRALPRSPTSSPVDTRLVKRFYDTGLDDLPTGNLDLILMIDSLCFDHHASRKTEVDYLHGFLRVLKPGGRFVHHMDCTCHTTVADVEALFAEAGFSKKVGRIPISCDDIDTTACRSVNEQTLGRFAGVFVKPK